MNFAQKITGFLKEDILAYALLVFGFVLRLFYIFVFTTPEKYLFHTDPGYYDMRALEMATGHFVMFSTYWPPFFHIFLSLIYRPLLWLGIINWRIKIDVIIFALFYIVGFWCIYKIVKKLFSQKAALIVLIAMIFWYPFIFFNYLVMSENLFFPLVFLGLYLLIVKPLKPSVGLWLGLIWGVAFITRPVFALVLPLFLIWGWYNKINWRLLLNFIGTVAIITASMMAFNFYYTHGTEKSVSSYGGGGFAMLWCDAKSIQFDTNGRSFFFAPPANIDYPDSKQIITAVPFENQVYYYRMGLKCLAERPRRLIENFSSVAKLFQSHLFPTIGNITYWEDFRLIFKILTDFLFLGSLLSIIGILTRKIKTNGQNRKYIYLMFFIVLSVPLSVYLLNVGEERYIIPYDPLLIILSLPIIIFLFNRILFFDGVKKTEELP